MGNYFQLCTTWGSNIWTELSKCRNEGTGFPEKKEEYILGGRKSVCTCVLFDCEVVAHAGSLGPNHGKL